MEIRWGSKYTEFDSPVYTPLVTCKVSYCIFHINAFVFCNSIMTGRKLVCNTLMSCASSQQVGVSPNQFVCLFLFRSIPFISFEINAKILQLNMFFVWIYLETDLQRCLGLITSF